MNVLLTGAFGNIGCRVLDKLLERGHKVTCFELANKTTKAIAKRYGNNIELVWGDIRDNNLLEKVIPQQHVIVHMAALIPPTTDFLPELSWAINVTATQAIVDIAKRCAEPPLLIFTSSFAVFGERQHEAPPRRLDDPVIVTDNYSEQKIACEQYIQQHYPQYCIMRLGAAVDERLNHANIKQLKMALALAFDNRVEFIHPADIATAICNAIETPAAHNQIHLIGGGKNCQVRHIDLLNAVSGSLGLAFRPENFGTEQLYADWADTTHSQNALNFQHHSLAQLEATIRRKFFLIRWITLPFAPLIRGILVNWLLKR